MLVVMCVDIRRDLRSMWARFVVTINVDLKNPGETDFDLDTPILIEKIVPDVFYPGGKSAI